MPSAFLACRVCGKPVYVGAKRCPNCRAPTSWRSRLRSKPFLLVILLLIALAIIDIALYGWPDQNRPRPINRSQSSALPMPAAAATSMPEPPMATSNRPLPAQTVPALPSTTRSATSAASDQVVAALKQRDTERAQVLTVRGKRIELGMKADDLFELVSRRDLLDQTIAPDPSNPPNLQFVKYYHIEGKGFSVELRKSSRNAPYTVTSIMVEPASDRGR